MTDEGPRGIGQHQSTSNKINCIIRVLRAAMPTRKEKQRRKTDDRQQSPKLKMVIFDRFLCFCCRDLIDVKVCLELFSIRAFILKELVNLNRTHNQNKTYI